MSAIGQREIATQPRLITLFKQFGDDGIAALVARLVVKARQLKQGMMQVLLTGRIRLV